MADGGAIDSGGARYLQGKRQRRRRFEAPAADSSGEKIEGGEAELLDILASLGEA
jgi:hypothetical protein